eukprot:985659-Karenia_brevis.AAC.1
MEEQWAAEEEAAEILQGHGEEREASAPALVEKAVRQEGQLIPEVPAFQDWTPAQRAILANRKGHNLRACRDDNFQVTIACIRCGSHARRKAVSMYRWCEGRPTTEALK